MINLTRYTHDEQVVRLLQITSAAQYVRGIEQKRYDKWLWITIIASGLLVLATWIAVYRIGGL